MRGLRYIIIIMINVEVLAVVEALHCLVWVCGFRFYSRFTIIWGSYLWYTISCSCTFVL